MPLFKPYSYSPLDLKTQEIRIVNLLPGSFDDPIRINIIHEPFIIKDSPPQAPVITEALLDSLPSGWSAVENIEGLIVYGYEPPVPDHPSAAGYTSWIHPDPAYCATEIHSENDYSDVKPVYEALSYAWESQENPETVYVYEPFGIVTTLKLGSNLTNALRYLRYIDQPKRLWVDAVCINQKDNDECGKQVLRMASIYSLAEKVLVWLGLPMDSMLCPIFIFQRFPLFVSY
jgi:hypothetical protein